MRIYFMAAGFVSGFILGLAARRSGRPPITVRTPAEFADVIDLMSRDARAR